MAIENGRFASLILGFPIALASAFVAAPAQASESGVSFYLLGSGGPGAAMLPPIEGVFIDNSYYHYHGEAKANREFVVGGNLVAGIDATMDANFSTILWIPSTDLAGGTLAIGGTLVIGRPDMKVDAIISGPRGNPATVSLQDDAWIVADPVVTTALGWTIAKNTHLATTATVNIPIGHYRKGQLANLSFHRWVVDASTALTWHDAEAGWDASAKAGLTFNGENDFTDYDTGTEFHLEGAIERLFSKQFSAGVQAYHFQQVSGDSGAGARLGSFKGRVSAAGATAAYNFHLGRLPVSMRGRILKEFGEKNRLANGTAIFLSLNLPIHVNMPTGAPPPH
jgi:hypothetical protein